MQALGVVTRRDDERAGDLRSDPRNLQEAHRMSFEQRPDRLVKGLDLVA
jgi:hypothetical protein